MYHIGGIRNIGNIRLIFHGIPHISVTRKIFVIYISRPISKTLFTSIIILGNSYIAEDGTRIVEKIHSRGFKNGSMETYFNKSYDRIHFL